MFDDVGYIDIKAVMDNRCIQNILQICILNIYIYINMQVNIYKASLSKNNA